MAPQVASTPTRALTQTHALTRPECRTWLEAHHEGRLGYRSGLGRRAVVTSYAVAGEQVVFRVPEYNPVLQYAPGTQVTLEVDGTTADELAETVTVTGEAHTADDEQSVLHQTRLVEAWPAGVSTRLVCLPLTRLEGTLSRRG